MQSPNFPRLLHLSDPEANAVLSEWQYRGSPNDQRAVLEWVCTTADRLIAELPDYHALQTKLYKSLSKHPEQFLNMQPDSKRGRAGKKLAIKKDVYRKVVAELCDKTRLHLPKTYHSLRTVVVTEYATDKQRAYDPAETINKHTMVSVKRELNLIREHASDVLYGKQLPAQEYEYLIGERTPEASLLAQFRACTEAFRVLSASKIDVSDRLGQLEADALQLYNLMIEEVTRRSSNPGLRREYIPPPPGSCEVIGVYPWARRLGVYADTWAMVPDVIEEAKVVEAIRSLEPNKPEWGVRAGIGFQVCSKLADAVYRLNHAIKSEAHGKSEQEINDYIAESVERINGQNHVEDVAQQQPISVAHLMTREARIAEFIKGYARPEPSASRKAHLDWIHRFAGYCADQLPSKVQLYLDIKQEYQSLRKQARQKMMDPVGRNGVSDSTRSEIAGSKQELEISTTELLALKETLQHLWHSVYAHMHDVIAQIPSLSKPYELMNVANVGALSPLLGELQKVHDEAKGRWRQLVDDSEASDCSATRPKAVKKEVTVSKKYMFRKKGHAWGVRFGDVEEFILPPTKGAAYLYLLLKSSNQALSAVSLAYQVARVPHQFCLGDAGEQSDKEAQSAYRARYDELNEEIGKAEKNCDESTIERLRAEMKTLHDEIKSNNWAGRAKKQNDDRERFRKAVGAAVRRTIKEIAKHNKELAEYFRSPRIRVGNSLIYDPPTNLDWEL